MEEGFKDAEIVYTMFWETQDRDIEVTSEVMDGPQSIVFDQVENRMHAQKAVMALTMR